MHRMSPQNRRAAIPALFSALLIGLLIAGGCNEKSTEPEAPGSSNDVERVPDFTLLDQNPNSASYQDSISPREYGGEISCWYFGSAT
ncbi:MAG: hypothetical protein ACE15D_16985 [Candidatus Eisenbacteria bacterium]|nr:hypothetical protein [Candidatus Eisenbacteria bacterium]